MSGSPRVLSETGRKSAFGFNPCWQFLINCTAGTNRSMPSSRPRNRFLPPGFGFGVRVRRNAPDEAETLGSPGQYG
jgi:hypothetical protein